MYSPAHLLLHVYTQHSVKSEDMLHTQHMRLTACVTVLSFHCHAYRTLQACPSVCVCSIA